LPAAHRKLDRPLPFFVDAHHNLNLKSTIVHDLGLRSGVSLLAIFKREVLHYHPELMSRGAPMPPDDRVSRFREPAQLWGQQCAIVGVLLRAHRPQPALRLAAAFAGFWQPSPVFPLVWAGRL
jgi:hypothetical protein